MYDERFARQYRYEPPSEFPLSLPFTGIVHHLSGPCNVDSSGTRIFAFVGGRKTSRPAEINSDLWDVMNSRQRKEYLARREANAAEPSVLGDAVARSSAPGGCGARVECPWGRATCARQAAQRMFGQA